MPKHAKGRPTEGVDNESLGRWRVMVAKSGEDGDRNGRAGNRGWEVSWQGGSNRNCQRLNNEAMRSTGQGCKMGGRRWYRERVGESKVTAHTSGLETDANILAGGRWSPMRETNQTNAVFGAGHTVAIRGELLGDGAMTDDDAGDGRGMICAYEDTAGCECGSISGDDIGQQRWDAVCGEAKETSAIRMVRMAAGVEEANLGTVTGQSAVREEERRVARCARHGPVVGVCEDGAGVRVVCLRQTTEQEALGIKNGDIGGKCEG